ncbi:hypothetical protein [Lutimonas vermicola]|uniref:Quinate/shikimate 5-dehydrogenase/glutamyl-tRNA reductase domain-containing protein n=1 Tax=Lutimonas vermicola TaxID=414288 RepID=A0ABU9L1Z3_9FLAO
MDSQTTSLDFAVIGHQDNWPNIQSFINAMRTTDLEELSIEKIKGIYGYIPPRGIFKMRVKSPTGKEINGVYIETFIEPDQLEAQHLRSNIQKVKNAIEAAHTLKAKMVILGGFTSILLEGNFKDFESYNMVLTTGNTLTTSYVLKGVEKAAKEHQLVLNECKVLIIGATGDIGMACSNYLKGTVKQLLLCARNRIRLENYADQLKREGYDIKYSIDLDDLAAEADIIISVASSQGIKISNLKKAAIICDAGYPKNLEDKLEQHTDVFLFHGGMGQLTNGYTFIPDYTAHFYYYPAPFLGHGCIIEVILMAFEGIMENYSTGRGNITKEKIDKMYHWSRKHGIELAPFYNSKGLL